jgi:hypothetical protein
LRPAKTYVVGYIYPRRAAAGNFYNFPMLFLLLINVNRNSALQEKWK